MPETSPSPNHHQYLVAAIEWEAATERMAHFLHATPGYPQFDQAQIVQMFSDLEGASQRLKAALQEERAIATADRG